MIDIEKLIQSANAITPLPETVTRLMALLGRDNTNISDIEDVFSYDAALSARLLRQANSAASGARSTIGTIPAAVVRLGFGSVFALAVSVSTQEELDTALPAYGMDENAMWRHAQAARLVVDGLRRFSKMQMPPETQTAALLHDIGKIVMARHLEPEILEVLKLASQDGNSITIEAEREVLEVHHGELGGLIAQHWQLPTIVVRGISFHHEPEACPEEDRHVAHIVCLANWAAKVAVARKEGLEFNEPPPPSMAILGVTNEKLEPAIAYAVEGLANLEAI